ncbi:hypothetical protein [Nesterenkonia ebinurensis]|uniref:hypothetical protein n=1 Tax=Nesterenkonia ebinurensis TaxID=2608252 RepID=UPI00168A62F4|nr:hypothetical protein [Nesterenkonia ebinurensis]
MAATDNKLRSIAGILGIGSIALVGITACDDNGDVEDPENGVEEPAPEEDPAEEDPMDEDPDDEDA